MRCADCNDHRVTPTICVPPSVPVATSKVETGGEVGDVNCRVGCDASAAGAMLLRLERDSRCGLCPALVVDVFKVDLGLNIMLPC